MSFCLNPTCPNPQNPSGTKFCLACGAKLLLKDRYRGVKPIGQGGFGRTFLAIDEDKPSKPPCVIKQFFPQAQGTSTVQKAVELFNQEAMRLDELGRHPQIPELLAHFTQDPHQYLVQEFIDGQTLAQELEKTGNFNENQVKQVLNDLLPVLQFIHSKNVIHRDIKPENVIRRSSDHKLVLVDFGASKVVTTTGMFKPGTSIGSPEYVAPEQLRGQAIFASDIYSLGVTCINLLTQMSPFDLYDANADKWVWRDFLTSPFSDALGKILDKMMEITPSRRYQSVDEVLKDLNPQQQQAVKVVAPPPAPLPTTQQQAVKVVASPPPPPVNSPQATPVVKKPASKSTVDDELAEISQIFGSNSPKNKNQQSPLQKPASPPAKPTNKDDLDDLLEKKLKELDF